jgi:hypothetical protein
MSLRGDYWDKRSRRELLLHVGVRGTVNATLRAAADAEHELFAFIEPY